MTNAQTTAAFLNAIDNATRADILGNIADHYGVTRWVAYDEITDPDAEHLLDYITGPTRSAVSVLMQRHGVSA
jgi:hypothetical protein